MLKEALIIAMLVGAAPEAVEAPPVSAAKAPVYPPHLAPQPVVLSPREAIEKAAEAAPAGVLAAYEFSVAAVGQTGDKIYLNSEEDYRDQRCLTLVVLGDAQDALRQQYGDDLKAALDGKTIRVFGAAQRVRIELTKDGEPTGKYYYQTHVVVGSPKQLLSVSPST